MQTYLARPQRPHVVLAAYADWECAQAPPIDEVFALAAEHPGCTLLIDTHCKVAPKLGVKRPTLLDWLPVAWVEDLCARAREAEVKIALAGSLGSDEICALSNARPDWFAVRGAVCDDADRRGAIDPQKVSELVSLVRSFHVATTPVS